MMITSAIQWLPAATFIITVRAQTHATSPHRRSFSQVILYPDDEYVSETYIGGELGYAPAEGSLPYSDDTDSFMEFDLAHHGWFSYLEDYLSSATLRVYSFNGGEVDFYVLTDDEYEWNIDTIDYSNCASGPCWVEVDVTKGLLWSLEEQPGSSSITIRMSVDNETEGAFASSIYKQNMPQEMGVFAPELIIDFDRHENLSEIQEELIEMKAGLSGMNDDTLTKKELKEKKKQANQAMKLNNAKAKGKNKKPGKKPGKKPNKKPGNKDALPQDKKDQVKPNNKPNQNSASANKRTKKPIGRPNKKPNFDSLSVNMKTKKPKGRPNKKPDIKPSNDKQEDGPSSNSSGSSAAKEVLKIISSKSDSIDNKLFLYESPADGWIPSSIYKSEGLLKGLEVMNSKGVNGMYFYLGGDGTKDHVYGLVNVAAFLAQSMKETIKYDACDENSWDLVNGRYPLSNACGQLNQSYQDYHCPDHERHMECPVDPDMEITAVTNAKWYGAPAPLFCRPKKDKNDFTGSWNYGFFCNVPWVDPPITCDDYEGQKAGKFENEEPYPNRNGRTDVEGCCWWGRGVIQTTGICNFGKLNYYLGARAKKEGRDAPYGQYDFCKDPEIICSSEENKELKWIAGMFYWMESVQKYDSGGWNYMAELKAFVDGGFNDPTFHNAVSGIVNRGCHNPPCGTGAVDGGNERNANFQAALCTFDVKKCPKDDGKGGGSPGGKGSAKTVCGTDWAAAAKCEKDMTECTTSLDCGNGEFCWAGVVC